MWRVSSELLAALAEHLGEPLDTYVNGSQTWLVPNGPNEVVLEWRLHPVPGYQRPPGVATEEVFAAMVGGAPPAEPSSLWDGLEAFPAYGDDVEPAVLRAEAFRAIGIEPDAFGLVDHVTLGDEWERSRGRSSIVDGLFVQLRGTPEARQ